MKLWTVTFSIPLAIVADTPKQALKIAQSAARDAANDASYSSDAFTCAPNTDGHIPRGWDRACIVYGPSLGATLGEVIDQLPPIETEGQ